MIDSLDPTKIYLNQRLSVLLPESEGDCAPEILATAAKNLEALGFGISEPLLQRLASLSDEQVVAWYQSVLPVLQEMTGAHQDFEPMYPNFPRQVMEASDAELFFNALTHYYGFRLSDALNDPTLVMLPNYEKEQRPELDEQPELRWLKVGSQEDFNAIFTKLASSNGSLSRSDKQVLEWFATEGNIEALLPTTIPQKETLALLVASVADKTCLLEHIKTATDVLRVAVVMSGGDVSLAQKARFRNFSKAERRFLLTALESCGTSRTEDMLRWKDRWVRLGERLHPGDFKQRFPESLDAFDVLRNGLAYETFNSSVEQSIRSHETDTAIELLARRPGEFARRLDFLLRTLGDPSRVLEAFLNVAEKVSTPVLLQAWGHFVCRDARFRAFYPKGEVAKVQFSVEPLPPIAQEHIESAAQGIRNVLVKRFSKFAPLGKCFIDHDLKHQIVPFSQRSASRTLRTVSRGSSFELPPGNTIRFFCWWKNLAGSGWEARVDLDLSASLFDDKWQKTADIAYYNLRGFDCFHSGDITSAPHGACEFIDLNLESIVASKSRYIVMSLLCFTGQAFTAMPECFAGWMMRQAPNSGEIFEPKTVIDKVDLTAAARASVPVIIDVLQRRVYMADIALKGREQINSASRNSLGFTLIGLSTVEMAKPTLYQLFAMHAEARGQIVSTTEQADTIFALRDGTVTAFDTGIILSEYLA